ncbi:MAG: hypothetical protein AAFS10_08625 [Myxococcota bacterium]
MLKRSRWPDDEPQPYLRLGLALLAAPFLWGLVASGFGFAVVALTDPSMDAALDYTLEVTLTAFGFLFGFTLTLGVMGILLLWILHQRGAVIWALTGGTFGAIGALLDGLLVRDGLFDRTILFLFVIVGWSLFLTIRWIAGIRESKAET